MSEGPKKTEGLAVRDLVVKLGGNVILKGVNLSHRGSGAHVVIGRNGSGKTTLAKTIVGLIAPQRGSILYDGVDYTRAPPWERRFAYASAPFPLIEGRTVRGTLEAIARLNGREDLMEVAARYQISHLLDRLPSQLSQGERQRVGVAAVVLASPRMAIFDEPLAHLSMAWAITISSEILKLSKREGVPVMLIVPRLEDAMLFGMDVETSVLHDGRIVSSAPLKEHLEAPASIEVIYGLDYHPENIVDASKGRLGRIVREVCGGEARYAWFRPQDIAVTGDGSVKGSVERVVSSARMTVAYVNLGGGTLIAAATSDHLAPGSEVGLDFGSAVCFDERGRRIN